VLELCCAGLDLCGSRAPGEEAPGELY